MLGTSTAKTLITDAVKPHFTELVSVLLKPKVTKLTKWLKNRQFKIQLNDLSLILADYLERTHESASNVNVLIFPNQQIKIKDIYQPLTIQLLSTHNLYKAFKIDKFDFKILETYKKIVIADMAGMGKSTLTKWITLKLIIEHKEVIPILIELRHLKEDYSIIDEIQTQFNSISAEFDKEILLKLIDLGIFAIILDGLDEIQQEGQEEIIKQVKEFIKKASKNYYILTSRPEGAYSAFGDFQLFSIQNLDEGESYSLIRKYDEISPVKIGASLIKDIKSNQRHTRELLGNPFLVSLLYSTYTYNKDIPPTKASFYEEIYSALYKKHDLSKDRYIRHKKSNLDIYQFKIILRQLAFDTALKGKLEFSEDEILKLIEVAKEKSPGISFNPTDFLDDLLLAVPLFQKDGRRIKWGHKSLQDYFAAVYIAFHAKKEDLLLKIYNKHREDFNNILDFLYEIDYALFRKVIIKDVLEDYINYYHKSYLDISDLPDDIVDKRKSKTFGLQVVYYNYEDDFNDRENDLDDLLYDLHKKYQVNDLKLEEYGGDMLIGFTYKHYLLSLLAFKKEKFIYLQVLPDVAVKEKPIMNGYEILTDNPKSWLNSSDFFERITYELPPMYANYYIVEQETTITEAFIDYNKALTELQEIKKDMQTEKDDLDNL